MGGHRLKGDVEAVFWQHVILAFINRFDNLKLVEKPGSGGAKEAKQNASHHLKPVLVTGESDMMGGLI